MQINFITTTWRHLKQQRLLTLINVVGLSLGLAVGLLMLRFVLSELSYDTGYAGSERLVRIGSHLKVGDRQMDIASSPSLLGAYLCDNYAEAEASARVLQDESALLQTEEKHFSHHNMLYADPAVLDFFGIAWLAGDRNTALAVPNTCVLTKSTAQKIFGRQDPIGRVLRLNSTVNLTVNGIVETPSQNTHLRFEVLTAMQTLQNRFDFKNWMGFNYYTYIRLAEGATAEGLAAHLPEVIEKELAAIAQQYGMEIAFETQHVREIHLNSHFEDDITPGGSLAKIQMFGLIGSFILLMACINFINLATAQSGTRAKEVGLRKVLGARRHSLVLRFLGETVVLSTAAMMLALALVQALLPLFNTLIGQCLTFNPLTDTRLALSLLGLILIISLLSGIYPAMHLSAATPARMLRARSKSGRTHKTFRAILVTLQFIISIGLAICTLTVARQLDYFKNYDMGFDKERLVGVPLRTQVLRAKAQILKTELAALPGVEQISAVSSMPGGGKNETIFRFEGKEGQQVLPIVDCDSDFLATLDMTLSQGRFFREDGGENGHILINTTLAQELGWSDAVGKTVFMTNVKDGKPVQEPYQVIGVVNDYHFESLHQALRPLLIRNTGQMHTLLLRLRPGQYRQTLQAAEALFQRLDPTRPFEYRFVSDTFDQQYRTELRLGRVFIYFSILALFIAGLGLFGLATFTAEQRLREIGIRKVLGASIPQIVLELSKDLTRWVLFANLLAWPLAWHFMQRWLNGFAYRIELAPMLFFAATLIALLIALGSTGLQTVRAALANPAESLHAE